MTEKTSTNSIVKNEKNDEGCPTPISYPCAWTSSAISIGCEGCDQWEKHHGTDCGEMMFCSLPCTFILDTVCLFVTIPKWIYQKTCSK